MTGGESGPADSAAVDERESRSGVDGRPPDSGARRRLPKLEEWFKRAGFVDIQVKKFLVPYGVWPKERYFVSFLSPAITSRY